MVEPAGKIHTIFFKKDKKRVLELLQREEIVEIIGEKKVVEEQEELTNLQTKIAQSQFVLDFLSLYRKMTEKKSLIDKINGAISPQRILVREKEIEEKIKNRNIGKIAEECQVLETTINESENLKEQLEKKKKVYEQWKSLPFNIKKAKETNYLELFCGKVKDVNVLDERLKKETKLYAFYKVSENNFFLLYHPQVQEKINNIIKETDAQEVKEIGELSSTVVMELEKIEDKMNSLEQERKMSEKKVGELSLRLGDDLKIIINYLEWQKDRIEEELKVLTTNSVMILVCWIDKSKIEQLKQALKRITRNFAIFQVGIKGDEMPPIIIKSKKVFQPVEPVLEIYGMPKPKEIDPIPFMGPFFVLFFGLCLSDAGYGLVLILLSLALIKLFKIAPSNRKIFYLLVYGGISTVFIGAIFGSWFGVDPQNFPEGVVKNLFLKVKLFEPMKNPLPILFLSFALGIVQLISALLIKMYWKIKNNLLKKALFDDFPWLYFIATILVFGLQKLNLLAISYSITKYLLLSGILGIVLTQGRDAKNKIVGILKGALALYGIISYLSDTLSYSRLLALGLVTAVIAWVLNLTAGIFTTMIPVIGPLIAIVILFAGHTFNLVISSLGAFIHSMRLQFVEFVPKFTEVGGRKFQPFKRESKYGIVISQ